MPATRLTKKYCDPKPPIDPLKGLILDLCKAMDVSIADLRDLVRYSK